MRAAPFAATAALIASSMAGVAESRDVSATTGGDWIRKFETLRCDPRGDILVASREPLRFAVTGPCDNLPRRFRGNDPWRVVMVDALQGSVRIFDLENYSLEGNSMRGTPDGLWRWLTPPRAQEAPPGSIDVVEVGPADTGQRVVASLTLPFEIASDVRVTRGDGCWLVSGSGSADAQRKLPLQFAFIENGREPRVRAARALRGVRFWHPREHAFVVQIDVEPRHFRLLDCAGSWRDLPEPDGSRVSMSQYAPAVSVTGDWAYAADSGMSLRGEYGNSDEIHILRGEQVRKFGWFGKLGKGCPDVNCNWDTDSLWEPEWSASGEYLLVQGYPYAYLLRADDLKIVRKWFGMRRTVLLSDSMAMNLERNRGVTFRHW